MPKTATPKELRELVKVFDEIRVEVKRNGKALETNGKEIKKLNGLCKKMFL